MKIISLTIQFLISVINSQTNLRKKNCVWNYITYIRLALILIKRTCNYGTSTYLENYWRVTEDNYGNPIYSTKEVSTGVTVS